MRIKHLLIGLLTAATAIACKQEDPVIVPEMDLSQTVATVSAEGGNVSFEVTSNVDWTASYSEDWVSVSPSAGKSSSSPVKVSVSVDPNESAASRNATVTISADKISKTFKVSQEGKVEEKPVPVEITWGVVGVLVGNDWKSDVAMSKNGSWLVAEGVEFEEVKFKIRGNGTWEDATNIGLAPGSDNAELNSKITVVTAEYAKANLGGDAADIKVNAEPGTYDVYFSFDNLEVWVMTPGYKPGDEVPAPGDDEPEYSIDGKQWVGTFAEGQAIIDFGYTLEDGLIIAVQDGDKYVPYMMGEYYVAKTDATSGTVIFVEYDTDLGDYLDPVEFPYSSLSETSVEITVDALGGKAVFAAADKAYEIDMNAGGSDDDGPEGTVVNGKYWFIEPQNQKVMTALDESLTYGNPAAADALDGASTPENAYTLTYDPDWSCFTIQDSYGRYLYSAVMADGGLCKTISVSETLPAGEREKAYYMWVVYAVGDGTYDIYNNETYYSITYSPENDNWEIYDPYEPDFANMYPTLVKAE